MKQIDLRRAETEGHQTEKLNQVSEVWIVCRSWTKKGKAMFQELHRRAL